jgi:DUF2075 family protein
VDGERVRTRPEERSRQDQTIKGYQAALRVDPEGARSKADAIIRNTYRTLMTRGMKGCYVYCVDPALSAHLRERLGSFAAEELGQAADARGKYEVD